MSGATAETTPADETTEPDETDETTEQDDEGQDDEGQEDEPEAATAPITENDPAEEEQRRLMIDKALEREGKRHEKALSALYGDEWDAMTMCPLCIGAGFMHPWQPGDLPTEQLDAIDALSGKFQPPQYVEDADYEKCAHCDGWGRTITGAQDPEHLTKLCDKCSGNGFVQKVYQPTILPVALAQPPANPAVPTQPTSFGAPGPNDQWNRPAGHPHYGIDPVHVVA